MTLTSLIMVLYLFGFLVILFFLIRGQRNLSQAQFRTGKSTELCLLYLAKNDPVMKRVLLKMAEASDKELHSMNIKELISNEAFILLEEIKESIKKLGNETDCPIDQDHAQKMVQELESMTNLMATVDKDSSPEYVRQICNEIMLSIEKMREE